MTIRHDAQIPAYSYLPDRDPRGFIRTGGSIPQWFFYSDDFFSFLDPVGFIWTVVFQKCLVMFLYGRFSLTTPVVFQIS